MPANSRRGRGARTVGAVALLGMGYWFGQAGEPPLAAQQPPAAKAAPAATTAAASDPFPSSTLATQQFGVVGGGFGPVVSVIPFDDGDHGDGTYADAVRIANDSDYGLAGTVWTSDVETGLAVARGVRTGTYGINTYTMDFAAPFGGFKASGLGREFGPEGLGQYTELKSIYTPPAG